MLGRLPRGALPDLVNGVYGYLMIDLSSIAYGVRGPRTFLVNVGLAVGYGYLRPSVIFVIDYSRPGIGLLWLRELG